MKIKIVDKDRRGAALGILAAYVAIMLCASGCTRSDDFENPGHASGEIEFTAKLSDASTRAVGDVEFATHGIYISGYHTMGKFADAVTANKNDVYPNVFNKSAADAQDAVPLVKEQTIDGVKKYILKTVKWTLSDDTYLNYFAWSQNKTQDAVSGIVSATKDMNNKGYPWLDIVNENNISKQVDIVGARHLNQQNNVVVSAVNLDFRHLLSKLSFKVKSSSGATVVFSKMNVTYGKVYQKARFTFDSDDTKTQPGSFTGHNTQHTGSYSLGTPTITNGAELLVSNNMVLIPQTVEKGFVKIELAYTITSGTGTIPQTKTVSLPAGELLQGINHIYTLDIKADEITVYDSQIADWIPDATNRLPIVPGLRSSDVLLLLDGYDKPYQHSDGKWYWLDRSGWNRHCEIPDITKVTYNSAEHCYVFNNSSINVPAFPSVTALSADIVCQNLSNSNSTFAFWPSGPTGGNDRKFYVSQSWAGDNTVYLDTDGTGAGARVKYTSSAAELNSRLLWSYQRQDKGKINIYLNAMLKATNTHTGSGVGLTFVNNKIGDNYTGKISHVRVCNKMVDIVGLTDNYNLQRARFNLEKARGLYLPVVTDGLIGCWDGRSGLERHNGTDGNESYWIDQAGEGLLMRAEVPQGVNASIKHDATNKAIVSTGPVYDNEGIRMVCNSKFPEPLDEFTIEIVSQATNPYLNYGMTILDAQGKRIIYARPNTGGGSDGSELGSNIYDVYIYNGLGGTMKSKRSLAYVINVKTKKAKQYQNGVLIGEVNFGPLASYDAVMIAKIILFNQENYRQAFIGNVYAFRLYNKELTIEQLLRNYTADKITFSLP